MILVDTSALFALLDERDPNHGAGRSQFVALGESGERLVLHNYILVETSALLQRRHGLAAVHALVDDVLPVAQLVWVDEPLHNEAQAALFAGPPRYSLVDWTSFLVMRRLGIDTAFAFDADFAAQGFRVIPA